MSSAPEIASPAPAAPAPPTRPTPAAGGRFVTVMPRSRREDKLFHKWLQSDSPSWELIWDRPAARRPEGPRDVWCVYRDPVGSAEGFAIIWVWSTLLTLRQQARRHRNIATAIQALTALRRRNLGPRSRVRGGPRIDLEVELILQHTMRAVTSRSNASPPPRAHL